MCAQTKWPDLFRAGYGDDWDADTIVDKCRELSLDWRPCLPSTKPAKHTVPSLPPVRPPVAGSRPSQDATASDGSEATAPSQTESSSDLAAAPAQTSAQVAAEKPAATSSNATGKQRRKRKAEPKVALTEADVKAYMAQRTESAEWVRKVCEWICGARDTRLAAMIQWAQLSLDAELAVTHFLAMEADARMRNDRAASTDTANGATATTMPSGISKSPSEAAPAPATSATASAATATPLELPQENAHRPATPPRSNAVSHLLAVSKELTSSRKKRGLSDTEAQAEHSRVLKSMRQLVHKHSPVRRLAEERVGAAKEVLDASTCDDSESCCVRADLLVAALGTPELSAPEI